MNKNNKIFWLAGLVIAVLLLLPYLGIIPKFGIVSNTDFVYMGSENYVANSSSVYILFGMVNLTLDGKNYSFTNGTAYYVLDNNASVIYTGIPNTLFGNHIVTKYNVTLIEDNLSNIKWWIAASSIKQITENYSISTQLDLTPAEICKAFNGTYSYIETTCTCPDGSIWHGRLQSRFCNPSKITVTTEKKVQIEPTFFEKYGTAGIIAVIFGIIIFYRFRLGKNRGNK